MPYAHNGVISQDPIAGGIEITREQYQEALAGMTQGRLITIDGGFAVVDQPEPESPEPLPEPTPGPEPERTFSPLEFLDLFTEDEQLAATVQKQTNPHI